MGHYDAILIPGGGVREAGELPLWVKARLDRAIEINNTNYMITLSAGTVHRPLPYRQNGFPIFESIVGGQYLIDNGIHPKMVLTETSSYDTVGNAYFSRVIHIEPRRLRRLLIIASEFHMPRTKAIFQWMYSLSDQDRYYDLSFETVPNIGIASGDLQARIEKEAESLELFLASTAHIHNLQDAHDWLFTRHLAYSMSSGSLFLPRTNASLNTY
jgi:DUF218 domain-containing protein